MNTQLFLTINSWASQNQWLDSFMVFFADKLGYLMIACLAIFIWTNRNKYRPMVILALSSAFISRYVFTTAIRFFYYHPRPFLVLQNVHQLLEHDTESSFPSGHASFYFAIATAVYLYNKKAGYTYFVLAALMGFARVFVGVHWPLDIIAGAGLGIVTPLLINFLKQKMPGRAF